MAPLPTCRWRETGADGALRCRSVKFVNPPVAVAADFCRACPYTDHAPCPPLPAPLLLDDLLPITPTPVGRPWDGLPPMFCITCRQTPERTAHAARHFRDRGLPVRFFPGIHGKTFGLRTVRYAGPGYRMPAGHLGLLLSHYMLWQTLAFLPHEEILILEDDATFAADFPERFHRAYADLPADWQFVFVGAVAIEGKPVARITDRVGVLRYPCGTHAYLVKRSALPLLLRTNHEARTHVDLQLIDNSLPFLRCYTFLPPLVGQHTCAGTWPTITAVPDDEPAPADTTVGPTGAWHGTGDLGHYFDAPLAAALVELFAGGAVADLGCGDGRYVRYFRQRGLRADGWDGNPDTPALEPSCRVFDLSRPVELGAIYDWVLSLEVGEHLPRQYEGVFLDNLHRHNRRGIVVSWAVPGQGGIGHVNERSNADVRARLSALGYAVDGAAEQRLRAAATCPWFPHTLMVFRRTREVRLRELERLPRVDCDEADPRLYRINRVHGLIDLLHALPPLGHVAEIGSYWGVSTEVLLLFAERVTAIDPWAATGPLQRLAANYAGLDLVREASPAAARHVADGVLDLVYIDGDHRYESVTADLRAWLPKVRRGGWLAGHDYTMRVDGGSVIRAVDAVLGKPALVYSDSSWVVQKA